MKKLSLSLLVILSASIFIHTENVSAQTASEITVPQYQEINPRNAFLRSLILPGWGHYYANSNQWSSGVWYLAADVALITSLTLLTVNSSFLETDMFTYARTYSGTDIEGRSRRFVIAVGSYNSLADYNSFQERTFNWDRMFEENPENFWEWESEDHRSTYADLRSRYNKVNRQIPTVIGFMAANRLISGISSFVQARNQQATIPDLSLNYVPGADGSFRPTASLRIRF